MFKFSYNWLKDYIGNKINFKELLNVLNLQGFEFQGNQNINDDIVTAIEVKANRPDMLSHMGIAREVQAFYEEDISKPKKSTLLIQNEKFPIKINVENKNICKRFCGLVIKNIDNNVQTPEYIKKRLSALGINIVNPVVDIANYVMIDMGQPLHSYDLDKISGKVLNIKKSNKEFDLTTLDGTKSKIEKNDIIICDEKETLCVAGIIGAETSSVQKDTKNILLEAAVFDDVSVRLTSRRLKISTPSSFRFERGVNANYSLDILNKCADMITEICGGEILNCAFDYKSQELKPEKINLSIKNCNRLLGTNFDFRTVVNYLEKYDFKCEIASENDISVIVPSYRLDVKKEVDLIEEVARIHGYDNIESVMPTIMTGYNKNEIWSKIDMLRNIMVGFGFFETINYSFIPSDIMNILGIEKTEDIYSELVLQNPIARDYALMRPTLVYSLLNCLAYNYSIGNQNLKLFECGRVYFKDETKDTNCREIDTFAFICSGNRESKGRGINKDIKFTFYDLLGYLNTIMNNFGQKFDLKQNNYKFLEEGSGFDILVNNQKIGYVGELNKSKIGKITNAKLIKDKIFYCEFYVNGISKTVKQIKFESKFPPVKRQYNLVQKIDTSSNDVIKTIKSQSDIIREVSVKDIYVDKTFNENEYAVLYEINYCSKTSTLTLETIEKIENNFLDEINKKYGISLKK